MAMRSNKLCWNPMEAYNFTLANEDHNCYTFDMRNLDHALNVHKDHVSAVMDLSFSPTGKEFVTASYDCTLRIFPFDKGHSRCAGPEGGRTAFLHQPSHPLTASARAPSPPF